MYRTLRRLAQNSLFYTFANSIEAFAPIVLAFILTRIIAPEDYGVWVLFVALVTFVRPFVTLSAQDALRMHYYEMNLSEHANLVWSTVVLGVLGASTLVLVCIIFGSWIGDVLSFPSRWLPAVPIAALLYAMFYFQLAYLQFASRRKMFLFLHVIQTSVSIALIGWFVYLQPAWQSVVVGKLSGLGVAIVAGGFWLARHIEIRKTAMHRPQLADLAKFGFLYLPSGLGLVAIPLTDRLIVTKVIGIEENGYFGAAALFGSAVYVAVNGFIHAWMPWLFSSLSTDRSERTISIVTLCFYAILPVAGVVAALGAQFVAPLVIGDAYSKAFGLIPWSIAGTIAMGYFFHNQAFLHYRKAVGSMSACSTYAIVANAIFSYYGALFYGSHGVFAATVVAFGSAAVLSRILRDVAINGGRKLENEINA